MNDKKFKTAVKQIIHYIYLFNMKHIEYSHRERPLRTLLMSIVYTLMFMEFNITSGYKVLSFSECVHHHLHKATSIAHSFHTFSNRSSS